MAVPLLTAIPLIGTVLDKAVDLFTGDDRAQAELLREQVNNGHLQVMGQLEINKVEAGNPSLFVAGARPALLWTCAIALFSNYIIRPYTMAFFPEVNIPSIDEALFELMLGMLGLGGLRSIEKIKGVAR